MFSKPEQSRWYLFSLDSRHKPNDLLHLSQFEQVRKLLENSKTNETALRDELDALREENLHLSLASDCGDDDSNNDVRHNTVRVEKMQVAVRPSYCMVHGSIYGVVKC